MKNKLLLFLLFFSFLGNKLIANDLDKIVTNVKVDSELSTIGSVVDTVKNNNKPLKTGKALAIIPPPQTTAGSACIEEGELSVKVFMSASGGSGDLIEWFSDQRSENVLFTGSIFGPSLSETTTYYVQSHTGPDFSIRVPVVASVYSSPSTVTLSVSPADGTVCEGTQVIFTANGGGDLFEFSIDGIVNQAMSINRDFETLTLKKGQVVSVRTRYGVVLDGVISETAWGKGALEDNILSAPLSSSASDGYVNSIKISPTEDKLVFGIAGKLESNKSMLLFLDTKPGGFNFSNDYGDEPSDSRSVRAFNYFNNNRNSFDAYFQADFCLAISKDDVGTNYYADIIELKSGNSTKVNLGNVSPGSGSSEMAVNNSNSGSGDYSLGFEVAVLKSLIGYTVGDIKFFALTMQDSVDSYSVTNSFLSPELSISADYGSDAVDYNIKDPNPVVVSANALIPCYKEASITINLDERPTTASVGSDQSSCILTSGSLGGNTPTIGTGSWTLTSGPGVASFSNVNSGGSTATVDAEGRYVFTWTISNGVCPSSSADINVDFLIAPVMPAASDQTECALSPIQTLTATATAQADESLVWYDAATGGNTVADPSLNSLGSVTYYAESVNDASSCTSASRAAVTLTINQVPEAPVSGGDQTECASSPIQILTATATAKSGETVVWYYEATGGNIALDPSLSSLGTYTFYAESVNDATSCVSASRTGVTLTLNSGPEPPVSGGDLTECTDRTSTQTLTATAEGDSISWYTIAVGGNTVSDPTQVGVGTSTYYAESSNGVCPSLTRTPVTLTIVGVVPNATANDETICSDGKSDQTITAIAVGNTITWYTDLTGGDVVSSPTQVGVGTATYYAESSIGNCVSESRTKVVLTITPTPSTPTATVSKQPTCTDSNGEIIIDSQSGVEYSIGDAFQDSPIFTDLESGSYTISVRFKDNAPCEVKGAVKIINPIPAEIQFESTGDCINKEYIITALPLESSYDLNNVDYQWKDNLGNDVGTNSNTLNVSDIIASSSAEITFPLNYTLTITSIATGCETTGNIFIESAFCNIQKGISPDGNGSNDYFDLRLMDVKKLEIFDRYGITVYSQINYSDQWKGQSDKGTELPSATYYYVIHFNNAKLFKTGWIYLIR